MQSNSHGGFGGRTRDFLGQIFAHVLADESSLSATTRDFLWHVTGPNFYSLNRLFDEQRRQIDYWLNQAIERGKAIGVAVVERADDLVRSAQAATSGVGLPAHKMVAELLALHESMARRLREDVANCGQRGDGGTADFLARLVEFHETSAWMLRMLYHPPGAETG